MRAVPCRLRCLPRRGFTLIDLAITIGIVGILSAVAVPRYTATLEKYRLEAATRRLVADLQLARRRALSQSASQQVEFDTANGSYALTGMKDPSRPLVDYRVLLAAAPYRVSIASAEFGGSATLTYNGYGLPSAAGTIVLQSGGAAAQVLVDAQTGEARQQ